MNLRNCPECGKLFAYDGLHKLCNDCRTNEEEAFEKVKEFLWDHPKATIEKVHQETDVEKELILKFVKEERLIAEGLNADSALKCDRCGSPISHGRYCQKCKEELSEGFKINKESVKKEKSNRKSNKSERMYTADRIKKR